MKGGDILVLTKLEEAMATRNISDAWLAEKALLSTRTVEKARKGRGISLSTGKRIAKVVKVKLEDLI